MGGEAYPERLADNRPCALDGEIDELSKADIDRHLEACTGCEQHLVFERDLKALVRRKCSEQPSEVVIERLRVEIRRRL